MILRIVEFSGIDDHVYFIFTPGVFCLLRTGSSQVFQNVSSKYERFGVESGLRMGCRNQS
jgi:hypothetical protein